MINAPLASGAAMPGGARGNPSVKTCTFIAQPTPLRQLVTRCAQLADGLASKKKGACAPF